MKNATTTGICLAGALLLGTALVSGCNRGDKADTASTSAADTTPVAPEQAATTPADTGTTSTAATTPVPTDTLPPTTMGNAGDDTGDMNANGTDANGMNGTTGTGTSASGTTGTPPTGSTSGTSTDQTGSDQNNNPPPPDQGTNP
jgi:hypothetical protein